MGLSRSMMPDLFHPLPTSLGYGDYLIFVDESGDHNLGGSIDPHYPVFVLVFCVFEKQHYLQQVVPQMQTLKMMLWGHDQVVFHEREIRKKVGSFQILQQKPELFPWFMESLNTLIQNLPFMVIAVVIQKNKLVEKYSNPINPYEIALRFGMERIHDDFLSKNQQNKIIPIVVESRGKTEDEQLKSEFLRICNNDNQWGYPTVDFKTIRYQHVFSHKQTNSSGLQLADLMARPIGLHVMDPKQPNRAYDVIQPKIKFPIKHFPP